MPNPSELERVEQELKYWRKSLKEAICSKNTKEYMLREIRKCEEILGIPSKPYNGNGDFSNV